MGTRIDGDPDDAEVERTDQRQRTRRWVDVAPPWIQAVGTVLGLIFVAWQIGSANRALRMSAEANAVTAAMLRTELQSEASDLLRTVNLTAIDLARMEPGSLDDTATGYSPRERLHILRLQYLERVFRLRENGHLDASDFIAEAQYRDWVVRRPGFKSMWTRGSGRPGGALRDHFEPSFAHWLEEPLADGDDMKQGDADDG